MEENEEPTVSVDPYANPHSGGPTAVEVQRGLSLAEQAQGEGLPGIIKSTALGAAAAASFGLVPLGLAKTGVLPSERQAELQKQNPYAYGAGEALGIAGQFLNPVGEAAAGIDAAGIDAAGNIIRTPTALSRAINPVKAAGELSKRVSGATASSLSGAVSSPIAKAIVERVAPAAVGSAAEGVLYGAGNLINEAALGDHQLNAEKIAANIGMGALYGGAIGGAIEGVVSPFLHGLEKEGIHSASGVNSSGLPAATSFEEHMLGSGMNEGIQNEIKNGLKELKPNVKEIDRAQQALGLDPATPYQRSANKSVQTLYDMTMQSHDPFAQSEIARVGRDWNSVRSTADHVLGQATGLSEAEMGRALKEQIVSGLKQKYEPVQKLYSMIEPHLDGVRVSPGEVESVTNDIRRIEDFTNSEGIPLKSAKPLARFANGIADDIENNAKNLNDLKKIQAYSRPDWATSSPQIKRLWGQINEKINDIYDSSALSWARDFAANPESGKIATDAMESLKTAKSQYRELSEKMSNIAEITGKRKVWGPQDLIDYVQDGVRPEALAKKASRLSGNSELLVFLRDEFPQAFDTVKQYQRDMIRGKATAAGAGGTLLDPSKVVSQIESLPKEAKAAFFNEADVGALNNIKTFVDSWKGTKFGPSGTPAGMAVLDIAKNPFAFAASSARSAAALSFSRKMAGGRYAAAQVASLTWAERAAQKTTNTVTKAVDSLFSASEDALPSMGSAVLLNHDSDDSKKTAANIREATSSASGLIDKLDKATASLFPFAPNHSSSLQGVMSRGTAFLQSKLPRPGQESLLGVKSPPNPADEAKFARYAAAVNDPLSVLKSIKNNTVSHEGLESLKSVYPRLYQDSCQRIMSSAIDAKARGIRLPYQRRVAIAKFLGAPTDLSMGTLAMQNNASAWSLMDKNQNSPQQAQTQSGGRASGGQIGKIDVSGRATLPYQKSAQRGP